MTSKTDTIENRSEIVFLYDAVDANPNGDPLTEENHPRVDEYTGEAIVTDVRLKRVVRDYIDAQGEMILVKASGEGQRDDKGDRYETIYEEMEPLLDDETDEESAFLSVATDVRLFGDSRAFDESPIDGSYTGPVQFNFGRSMHSVHEVSHGKTSVLSASSEEQREGKVGGNMYTDHRLAYALMRFHGVVNENAAEDTGLSERDVALLENGLWYGTRELTNTSSKRGHEPRLLLRVEYGEDDYHIGDLHHSLSLRTEGDPKAMRDVSDAVIEVDDLLDLLGEHDDRIETVHIRASRRLRANANSSDGGPDLLEDALTGVLGVEGVRFHDE